MLAANKPLNFRGRYAYYSMMTFLVTLGRCAVFLVLSLGLAGCLPTGHSQLDEEKEPHFLAGKSRANALDFPGALECYEKALEVNPRSASAHFEAGVIYESRIHDHAAAIYHFQRFLQLRPGSGYAEVVKQHILACKQELAKTVSLGPVTQSLQRDFEQLTAENKRLRDQVEQWRAYAARVQTNNSSASAPRPSVSTTVEPAAITATTNTAASRAVVSPVPRTHTVKSGDTPAAIAHKYGVRLEALMTANPRVDARRLRVGQTLNIPLQ